MTQLSIDFAAAARDAGIQKALDSAERNTKCSNMKTNYSNETSRPAYEENQLGKQIQADIIYSLVLKKCETTLKELSELTGLEQSTVSGRTSDLIREGKVMYSDFIRYKERKRKRIIPTTAA